MKESRFDLITSILAAIVGGAIAFFVCNMLLPKIEDVKYKTLESAASSDIGTLDEEIFNSNAINPTVEVCVGCTGGESDGDEEGE